MPYIPHTKKETEEMLAKIGLSNISDLYKEIPQQIIATNIDIKSMNEFDVLNSIQNTISANKITQNYIGYGAYEHHIPAVIWEILTRGEFLTPYTPYQAEKSQGTLQTIYEYQSMISSLTGMDVSNASVYDGSTSIVESIFACLRDRSAKINSKDAKKENSKVLLPKNLNQRYIEVIKTFSKSKNIELIEIDYDSKTGKINVGKLIENDFYQADIIVVQQPNSLGILEDIDEITDKAHEAKLHVVACVNPITLGILKEPGKWGNNGADIACGEGQPLGIPLLYGGPYFGFMCCKSGMIRQLPGRIVGKTKDLDGNIAYTLTLQAREQHIRRAKASSNICTNQNLFAAAATIYMSLLGLNGIKNIGLRSHIQAKKLADKLTSIDGIELAFNAEFFNEFAIKTKKSSKKILQELLKYSISGGKDLAQVDEKLDNTILICATETKTDDAINNYYFAMKKVLEEI